LGLADHNAVSYYYNGLAPQNIPLQAKLANLVNSKNFSYSHTFLPDYGKADWHRHILSFRGRKPFAVIDLLEPKVAGDYQINFNWHFLGNGKVEDRNSYYGKRIAGRHETGFFLTYPASSAGVFEQLEPERKKLMERHYILPAELKFISLAFSKKSGGTPVGMLTLLSAWRINKPAVPEVKQIDQTSYIVKFNDQSFYIVMPMPGKTAYDNGKVKAIADFAAFSDKTMFLVNATQVTINNQDIFKKEKAFTGEIAVNNPELSKILAENVISQTVSETTPTLPAVGKIVKSLEIKSGTKILRTESGFIIGTADGNIVSYDSGLHEQKSFKAAGEVLSLINSKDKGILAGTSSGKLYSFDSHLNPKWQVSIPQCNHQGLWYSLRGPKVKTLFTTEFNGKSMIFAGMGDEMLQAVSSDGKLLWNRLLKWGIPCEFVAGDFRGQGKELIAGIGIIAQTPEMYMISPAGKIHFKSRVQNSGSGGMTLLKQTDGKLLVGTSRGTLGLYEVNKAAILKVWDIKLGRRLNGAALVMQSGKKIIAAISDSGFVNAFDMQGKHLWFTNLNSPVKFIKALPNGNGFITVTLKNISIINPGGEELASQKVPGEVLDFSISQMNGKTFATILTAASITQLQLNTNNQ
jgi:hypothetical protein